MPCFFHKPKTVPIDSVISCKNSKKNLLLLSSIYNMKWIEDFFAEAIAQDKPILFVPYARPDGMSEKYYFYFNKLFLKWFGSKLKLICAPSEGITAETLENVGGIFVGGGNTYVLLDKLQKTGSLEVIRQHVENGLPYCGSSAGSNVACPTIKTTNDMPCPTATHIDLNSLNLIDVQINPHYMDKSMFASRHSGETRDVRLKEFCAFNPDIPVIGLYEDMALRVKDEKTYVLTSQDVKMPIFCNGKRKEIECKDNSTTDISEFCKMGQTSSKALVL